MNKQALLDQISAVLSTELAALTRAANVSFAAATDPDSKAENKYDTRSLEASYVARGQAQRVAELQEAVHAFAAMSGVELAGGSVINVGALVSLQMKGYQAHYFLATHAGGTEVEHQGQEVSVITPASPLGQKLMGKRVGDSIQVRPDLPAVVSNVR